MLENNEDTIASRIGERIRKKPEVFIPGVSNVQTVNNIFYFRDDAAQTFATIIETLRKASFAETYTINKGIKKFGGKQ